MKLPYNFIAGKDPHDILMNVSECVLTHAHMYTNACMHVCMNHHVSAKAGSQYNQEGAPVNLGRT